MKGWFNQQIGGIMRAALIIKKMPEKCAECQLAEKQGGYWYCNALHEYTSYILFHEDKPENCPLQEVNCDSDVEWENKDYARNNMNF